MTLDITSTAATDLDVLLVSPSGEARLIMSDAGGYGYSATTRQVVLSDEAGASLPDPVGSAIPNGGYKPTNLNDDGDDDTFAAPAPASTGTSLDAFDGEAAAGVWKLYVMDDAGGDTHTINSWKLSVELSTAPYPSNVTVSGMPTITDVDVVITGVTSAFSQDIHLLLVGPGNQQSYLWGYAGGGNPISGATITFDDEAATDLPESAPIVSGAYRPQDYYIAPFPAPAPVASGDNALSVFDGLSPNGTWQLFAYDYGQR